MIIVDHTIDQLTAVKAGLVTNIDALMTKYAYLHILVSFHAATESNINKNRHLFVAAIKLE